MNVYIKITNLGNKTMKTVYKEFCCPQCGELRHINVNGICFDCSNENTLLALAEQRKLKSRLHISIGSLRVESYN
ncbi:MAG: hypothetical protein JSV23_06325 [Promethearchaeota archaeon]|nr:MAG: hypothetical protein JSV23_06325 [Candidatus Lokiarchaeota archaeon]